MKIFSNRKIALLLVLSLVLSAVPFPGNVETVYATEVEEQVDTESTAESTDAPADPYIINENYDGKANSALADTVTEKYSWAFAGDTSGATVVSKADVISGGAANDYCVKLPSSTSKNNTFVLSLAQAVSFGQEELANSNLIIEMDVALVGETLIADTAMANLRLGKGGANVAADRLLNFDIKNDQMVRVNSSKTSFVGATLTRGALGYGFL